MILISIILSVLATAVSGGSLILSWKVYRRDSSKLERDRLKEQRLSEPHFIWGGGTGNFASGIQTLIVERDVTNKGGAISNVSISADNGTEVHFNWSRFLEHNQAARIEFRIRGANQLPVIRFRICYETVVGTKGQKCFEFKDYNHGPKEIVC